MANVRDSALHFEAISLGLKKTNAGPVLTLRIHPHEMPKDLWDYPLGARYTVALVLMGDDGQPVEQEQPKKPDKVPRNWSSMGLTERAGIVCRDRRFWEWASTKGHGQVESADEAAEWLRKRTAVRSRAEYDKDPRAGRRYLSIENEFRDFTRYGEVA